MNEWDVHFRKKVLLNSIRAIITKCVKNAKLFFDKSYDEQDIVSVTLYFY